MPAGGCIALASSGSPDAYSVTPTPTGWYPCSYIMLMRVGIDPTPHTCLGKG